jgi:hypothetical protein
MVVRRPRCKADTIEKAVQELYARVDINKKTVPRNDIGTGFCALIFGELMSDRTGGRVFGREQRVAGLNGGERPAMWRSMGMERADSGGALF